MRHVKWLFVVLLMCSLTAFIEKDKPTGGLSVGDVAPDLNIETASSTGISNKVFRLTANRGKYVLLSFWASYDAPSRMNNVSLNNVLRNSRHSNVEMVSVSFDDYRSVFEETLRNDHIVATVCALQQSVSHSEMYQTYRLNRGFGNYLIDAKGIIIAKNISAKELSAYLCEHQV